MKAVILLVCLLSSSFINAAKWEKVESANGTIFETLFSQLEITKDLYRLVSKKNDEPMDNSLTQLTYIKRYEWGVWSYPQFAYVEAGDDNLAIMTEDNSRQEPAPFTETTFSYFQNFFNLVDVEIYEGVDGNTFGDCANTFLYHKKTSLVGMFSVCYSE